MFRDERFDFAGFPDVFAASDRCRSPVGLRLGCGWLLRWGCGWLLRVVLTNWVGSRILRGDTRGQLARELDRSMIRDSRQIQPVTTNTLQHPLSWFQERLWLLNQKHPQDLGYNLPVALLLEGPLDVAALNRSLSAVCARHQGLRARFVTTALGRPVQSIASATPIELPVVLAGEDEVPRHVRENAEHVFDLERGPIVVGRVLELATEKHLLLLNVHHIAADGWSIERVFLAELQQCYAAFAVGQTPALPPLPIQYTDFAHFQREQERPSELTYWHEQLAGYQASLEVPTDFPRTAQSGRHSGACLYRYDQEFSRELSRFARAHGCTLFMCLFAGFALLVNRHTGKEDLCIGTTSSGRSLPELEGLIGFFINILPLRVQIDEEWSVGEYLAQVRKVALAGFDHQMVPFERILYSLDRPSGNHGGGLVPLVLRHQNYPRAQLDVAGPSGLRFSSYAPGGGTSVIAGERAMARCELELSYTGDREELEVEVMYAADLYRRQTVERLLAEHEQLLRAMFMGASRPLRELSPLTDADVELLHVQYNAAAVTALGAQTFVERWDAQVRRTPDAIACHDRSGAWRYGELAKRANQLAHVLSARGVTPGEVVGVCLERGGPLLLSLLAIWKVGAAYVPLDPSYPEAYLRQIVRDANPKQTICAMGYQDRLGLLASECCVLEAGFELLAGYSQQAPEVKTTPDALAYLMYTSGSTGVPKGVRVPHRQLLNWLGGLEVNLPFAPDDVVAQKTTFAFAVSVKELFAGLLNGCALVFLDDATVRDSQAFVDALKAHQVSRLNLVPSHLGGVLARLHDLGETLPSLRVCVTAGEPLTAELVTEFRRLLPHARLLNNYGCTELNDVTYYDTREFDGSQGFVPIGKPIQNTRLYVLDRQQRLVPPGVPGELHVATAGMSKGYQGLPSLTQERYLDNPFGSDPSGVLYNTGDVVRFLPDGNLEYLGRWDFQVKVRGFRVDVRQVEKVLASHGKTEAHAVVGDGSQLVAYYVQRPGETLDVSELRTALQARLPEYMVPTAYVVLQEMPRLPNGKLDRRALRPSAGRLQQSDAYEPPRTDTERTLAVVWSEVLEVAEDQIGRRSHFFEIGGHSLSASRLVARVNDRLGVELGLSEVFEHPRLNELASYISEVQKAGGVGEAPAGEAFFSAGQGYGGAGVLANKVVLVTGASRGIGNATVRLLASQGARVAINYVRSRERAQRAKELITQDGGIAEVFQADITDPDQVTRMVQEVCDRFGQIDVLVVNAAIGFKIQPFVQSPWLDFERKLTDELKAVFFLFQAVIPGMLERGCGSIVAVSSTMSRSPENGYTAHSAAKGALDAFVRALAGEVGPGGVRVNTVAPGLTLTDATAPLPRQQKEAAAASCPLRRNGLPSDVAGAILFLASDLSRFMTGSYLPVDGGYTLV